MDGYLVDGPVDPGLIGDIIAEAGKMTGCGGHNIFLGQVRDDISGDKRVVSIEYSAYEMMVRQEADKIISEVSGGFADVKKVKILHSTGVVNAGEISLFVMVSAGHRGQAIEACRVTVEKIKERLPVWKREIFSDSSHRWK